MTKVSAARERLLKTASRLFYSQGLNLTGIDQIIAEAGVAKSTFYRYFPAKTDLINAYLQQRHEYWMALFCKSLDKKAGVQSIVDALSVWFRDPEFHGCAYINAVAESGVQIDEKILTTVRWHKSQLKEKLAEFFTIEDEDVLESLMIVIEGLIVRYQITADLSAVDSAKTLLKNQLV